MPTSMRRRFASLLSPFAVSCAGSPDPGPTQLQVSEVVSPGTSGGAHATGTFSATVSIGGAAVQVTQGAFDTPVMTTGG